ncbi:MAG: endolytic transglycosylase MltG [Bacteroidetes bacterium]|nr:endolytic transglycosylase MltG [Bacteroidota bacterium]
MRIRNTLLAMAAVFSLAIAAGFYAVHVPRAHRTTTPVEIPRGTPLRSIAAILEEQDIVSNDLLFIVAAKLSDKGRHLQSGLYLFPPHLSMMDVLTILSEGSHQAFHDVTIREGLTLRQIAHEVERKTGFAADTILKLSRDPAFLHELGVTAPSLEGYLLPETYRVRYDETPRALLRRAVHDQERLFTEEAYQRMRTLRRTKQEILIMASLVEGETRQADERPRVAGVYYNRLRRGMLLQADPTIQYIIPDGPRRLMYRDLSINSPYNTYMYPGLPPGPVNNPGKESILAALAPETHDFLYFVADGHGGHTFSRNVEEHNRAVAAYRKARRK